MKLYRQRNTTLTCSLLLTSCSTLLAPVVLLAMDFTIGAGQVEATNRTLLDNETGVIEIGGSLNVTGGNDAISALGDNVTVTNRGTIDAGNNGIRSSGLGATITSSGSIIAGGDGIFSIRGRANITNSGSIMAVGDGISSNRTRANITNSGSIIALDDGISSARSRASITNSGSIHSDDDGIDSEGANATIINSGSIHSDDDGIDSEGDSAIISNSGFINADDDGISAEGDNVRITNSGFVDAVVSGIESVGDNPTINNSGTITGDNYGVLGSSLNTDNNITLNLLTGSKIFGRIDLGAGNDTANIYGTSTSANLTFENTENINLFGAGVVSGNNVVIVDATGESTRDVALSQLTSSVHNLISQRMTYTTSLKPVQVAALTLSPGMFLEERKPFAWAQAFGGKFERDAEGDALAFDSRHRGINFGYEWDVNQTRVGLVGGIVNAETESQTASFETETDSYYIGAYSHLKLGMLNLTTSLIGGFSESDNKRVVINNLNGAELAESDVNSTFISPAISIGAAFKATKIIELRPSFNANYSVAWIDGYKESGTTNSDLTVDKRRVEVSSARVQLGTAFKMTEASELELRVGANSRDGSSVNVDASVAGNAFSYENVGDESVTGGFVGVNLLVATKDNIRLLADVEFGGNSNEEYVNAYLRLDYLF